MNSKRLISRLKKIESLNWVDDGTFTLEELCRSLWNSNKSDFVNLTRGTPAGFFIAQFEREEEERDKAARRAGSARRDTRR